MMSKANGRIRILIADDHLVVRMGIAAIIELEQDLEVVGEAVDGEQAVQLSAKLNPDVIILDLMMPKLDGATVAAAIRSAQPDTKILILSSFCESEEMKRALDAGVDGALTKDSNKRTLLAAIRGIASGQKAICPEVRNARDSHLIAPTLSARQTAILEYVAKGLNNKEIARQIGIGPDCVKAHLKAAFARLGVSSRSEAVATAIREHLLRP